MADDQGSTPSVPKSIIEVTAFMPEARRDPHPPLKALREQCPVMRDEMARTWFLTRYGDVRTTVNDRSFVRHPLNAEEGSISRQLVDEENPRRTSQSRTRPTEVSHRARLVAFAFCLILLVCLNIFNLRV